MEKAGIFLGFCAVSLSAGAYFLVDEKPVEVGSGSNPPSFDRQHPKAELTDFERPSAPLQQEEKDRSLAPVSGQILTPEDRDTLLAYLAQTKPETLESGEWEERVNEILNLLRSQPGGVPGLAELMLEMAEEDPNPVMRMYALQHIAMWIPDETSEDSRKAMMDYLQQVSLLPDDPLAGSAVLFLSDLQRNGSLPECMVADGMIGETALRIASAATATPDVRIAALHACVDQGTATALPAARMIAADASLMIPLRKAAIHTIGQFGTPEDAGLIESIAIQTPALTAATKPALERLGGGEGD